MADLPTDPFAPQAPKMTKADENLKAQLRIAAAHAGDYWEDLTAGGRLPQDLAADLVRDWHGTYWETAISESEPDD